MNFHSLRARLLLSMVLVVLCTILIGSLSMLKNQRELAYQDATSMIESLGGMVVTNVTAPLLFGDPAAAEQTLGGLQAMGDIRSAVIFDATGQPFSRYGAELSEKQDDTVIRTVLASGEGVVLSDEEGLYSYEPVISESETIGLVFLANDMTSFRSSIDAFYRIVLIAGLVAFLFSFLLMLWLQHMFTTPLSQMIAVIKQITLSKDYSQRSPTIALQEFDSLSQSFNHMIAVIEERGAQLEAINSELEKRVMARTAELESALKMANESSQAKSQFMAVMSHEVRTPLNGIMGFLEILKMKRKEAVEDLEILSSMDRSAHALLLIINDILDFSKLDAKKAELEVEECRLIGIVRAIIDENLGLLRKKNIVIELQHSDFVDGFLGDAVKIRQIINNYISNAIKFTDTGSIQIELAVRNAGDECLVRFQCRDSGIGIPEDKIERIFSPFVQVDSSITRKYGGTGLGLSISKQLIELMYGQYGVESQPGKGSTFWFEIPLTRLHDENSCTLEARTPNEFVKLPMRRILVAEDNSLNQELMKRLLSALGQRWDICANGAAAVQMAAAAAYDLILMDYHMPEMDGVEATQRIRESCALNKSTPIIALTADVQPHVNKRFSMAGANGILLKPFNLKKLNDCLLTWLCHIDVPSTTEPANVAANHASQPILNGAVLEEIASLSAERGWKTVHELAAVFFANTPRLIESIKAAVAEGDNEKLFMAAHSLKSSSGNIGATKLFALSRELEHYGREAQTHRARNLLESLQTYYGETARVVQQTLSMH